MHHPQALPCVHACSTPALSSPSSPTTAHFAPACAPPPPPPSGDLGAIAREYDIAVSTSCPALDYIVVDTTSAAQRCVELLRQRQLGVATFLILEKQQHLVGATKEKKQAPEGGWVWRAGCAAGCWLGGGWPAGQAGGRVSSCACLHISIAASAAIQ